MPTAEAPREFRSRTSGQVDAAIGFVHDFADLGAGQAGYNEGHEFYGYRMPI